jgi:hypothetical protein
MGEPSISMEQFLKIRKFIAKMGWSVVMNDDGALDQNGKVG